MEYYQGNVSVSLRVKAIIKGDMIFLEENRLAFDNNNCNKN